MRLENGRKPVRLDVELVSQEDWILEEYRVRLVGNWKGCKSDSAGALRTDSSDGPPWEGDSCEAIGQWWFMRVA